MSCPIRGVPRSQRAAISRGVCDRCDCAGVLVDTWNGEIRVHRDLVKLGLSAGETYLMEYDDGVGYCRPCAEALEDEAVRYEEMRWEGGAS